MMVREVPAKLGRYEIVKHLANGGMAQVLIARATGIEGFERHVVVKRINADHAADPAFVQMFLDEARTAAALHHNNIVQVHDIGKENGEYFFAMEYVHGQDLRIRVGVVDRMRGRPFEDDQELSALGTDDRRGTLRHVTTPAERGDLLG
jgi:serine/threonine protein kinase